MNILEFDYDLENGFAWILIPGENIDKILTVQCCLNPAQGEEIKYEKKITALDCGHDWGLSGDQNYEAFELYGEDVCMDALFNAARDDDFIIDA